MPRIDSSPFETLAKLLAPPPPPDPVKDREWFPRMTPTQEELYFAEEKYILCHGEKGGAKCRTGDAMIYTVTGLRRLKDFRPANAVVGFNPIAQGVMAFDGKEITVALATGLWVEESRLALRCHLANGAELIGSPRHPVWVCEMNGGHHDFRYASIDEILKGMTVGRRYWTPLLGHPDWTGCVHSSVEVKGIFYPITERLAYAVGALVGDGTLGPQKRSRAPRFSNTDKECIDQTRAGLLEIGCSLKHDSRCDYSILPGAVSRELVRALDLEHLCYFKRIPDKIINSPKSVVAAFIRGLFDTDGTVSKTGQISFCTTSEKLGLDVQDALAAFGIMAVRRSKNTASRRPTWGLTICGRHAARFGQEIGFSVTRKQSRISYGKKSFRCPHGFNHNRYGYPDPIKSVWRRVWKAAEITKDRKTCDRLKRLQSFGSIPSREKVGEIIGAFGSAGAFKPFLLSDTWLEIKRVSTCERELLDLTVPGPHSFLASGTINHNTWGCLDKLVQHCYLNENAMALILVPVMSMANKGGAWSKLQEDILPAWRDGNRDREGRLLDEGMGLHFTDVKFDKQHNELIWIQNQYDIWSCVVMISAPHASQLKARIKGYEPSFVFVDEVTSCSSRIYFTSVAAQLGRRRYIEGPQQWVGATNPDDPDSWPYKTFFVEPFDDETGEWDKDFRTIQFPISENMDNLVVGYHEGLRKIFKGDPIEALRMIGGEWVAKPSGEALFGELFNPSNHVFPLDENGKPDPRRRLMMNPDFPLILGLDPGGANNGFAFMQYLPIDGRYKWIIFDEVVTLRKKIDYRALIPVVMRRIKWWRDKMETDAKRNPQVWISDNSAFNQFRGAQGSYDVLDFERIYEENRQKIGLEPLGKIKACPKFNGSDIAQTQLGQRILMNDEVVVSAACVKTQRMFLNLDSTKQKDGEPFDPRAALTPRRSDSLHLWKAIAYPWLYASISPTALLPSQESTQQLYPAS